jgi:hypothetical protein
MMNLGKYIGHHELLKRASWNTDWGYRQYGDNKYIENFGE